MISTNHVVENLFMVEEKHHFTCRIIQKLCSSILPVVTLLKLIHSEVGSRPFKPKDMNKCLAMRLSFLFSLTVEYSNTDLHLIKD